jgi:uncharacterized protein (DUF2344 family)
MDFFNSSTGELMENIEKRIQRYTERIEALWLEKDEAVKNAEYVPACRCRDLISYYRTFLAHLLKLVRNDPGLKAITW